MANDLNQCNFIGRLGKDPEIRFLPSGDAVASFSIAIGSSWKDKQGQKQERTEWINCNCFGKLAQIIGEYLKKGSRVYISGEFTTRKWQDQSGSDRYSTEIKVRDMQMLDSKQDSQSQSNSGYQQQNNQQQNQPMQPTQNQQQATVDFDDDTIPF